MNIGVWSLAAIMMLFLVGAVLLSGCAVMSGGPAQTVESHRIDQPHNWQGM